VRLLAVVLLLTGAAACASGTGRRVPPGTARPDQYLFDRGTAELQDENWLTAREFFREVYETYVQSPLRPDAKLSIGDTYFGEGSSEALLLAVNEFQEFLTYYPTHTRADYAQYKVAMCHFRQMRNPERDQTETRDAIREFETFAIRYPNSSLLPEVTSKLREARDRLSESDYRVGVFYFRIQWYPGAVDRLSALLKQDPEFSNRDGVYYFLGESLIKMRREAEALPMFERLVAEFEMSDHLEDARKRIAELKAQVQRRSSS
jgi:outer membrane protein assembly factor BamD